ncbi:hypothetical protein [Paraburkholderia tropica]|uniref:hypothetical protein n=1 Tax=Paraburkholderia tropica TaxID=92647 RepID=UPI001F342320|nr:hypothetical protein [Paraburkholderia tropica]
MKLTQPDLGSCEIKQGTGAYFQSPFPERIHLVVMGKDPFPNASTAVPFCKPCWKQQFRDNSSGKHVLNSLGITQGAAEDRFETPRELFEALRHIGVIFLNASYEPVEGSLQKRRDRRAMDDAFRINEQFLTPAKAVVFCGEARRVRWILPQTLCERSYDAVHPDVRNRANLKTRDEWRNWWEYHRLADRFELPVIDLLQATTKAQAARVAVVSPTPSRLRRPG